MTHTLELESLQAVMNQTPCSNKEDLQVLWKTPLVHSMS